MFYSSTTSTTIISPSGTGTSFTVDSTSGVVAGMRITVGTITTLIDYVNTVTNVVNINTSVSWTQGQLVTLTISDPNNLWYAVQQYCESTETTFVAQIPEFVQAAEERIYNAVQLPAIRRNSTGVLTASNQYLTLPPDWLATFSLSVVDGTGAYSFLLNKDVNFLRESFPNPSTTGLPQYYAIFDDNTLILAPTPDDAYTAELHYYYYPESIVTAGNSWVGTHFESILLYGTIREAYTYLKGETDLAAAYETKYQEALALLKTLGEGKDRRDAYRSGQIRSNIT